MLRVEFTTEDLARLRIGTSHGPLIETALALRAAQPGDNRAMLGGWRQRLANAGGGPSQRLVELFPRVTYFDLIGFTGSATSLEEGLDTFRRRSVRVVDEEITYGIGAVSRAFDAPGFRPPPWVSGLLDRGGGLRKDVASDLVDFHGSAVAPYWPRIQGRLQAEHTRLVWTLAERGAEAVLGSLHPTIRWRPPVLEIDGLRNKLLNVRLRGRGLTIVPSFFCSPAYPLSEDVADPDGPFTLLYPSVTKTDDAMSIWHAGPPGHKALAALLGQTRAIVLLAIAEQPCTTGELATRACTSPASASQHATVLRNAGLVTTDREGPSVRHRLTVLGCDLIG